MYILWKIWKHYGTLSGVPTCKLMIKVKSVPNDILQKSCKECVTLILRHKIRYYASLKFKEDNNGRKNEAIPC